MNIMLAILLVLVLLIVLLLVLALVTKSEFSIEREVTINRPRQAVFDYLKLLKNQEYYSIWVMQDPTNQITYHGVDGTVGFVAKWEGKKQAGKGEQEIVSLVDDSSLHVELRFEKPFKNIAQTYMIATDAGENQTKVKWKMVGRNKFPMTLFNLVADGLLGKDMDKSLIKLKEMLTTNRNPK